MGFVASKPTPNAPNTEVEATSVASEAPADEPSSSPVTPSPPTLPIIVITAPSREDLLAPNPPRTIEAAAKERRPGVPICVGRQPFKNS
ncbi:hypothetical protein GN956_G19277 [Arapaima gigas]